MLSALKLNSLYRWRYPVAIVVTGLTYLARAGLQPILGEPGEVVLSTLAIVLSALNGGAGPGVLATALTLLFAVFTIFEPRGFWVLVETTNLLTLGLFALVGASISAMAGAMHASRRRLEGESRSAAAENLKLNETMARRQAIESMLRESETKLRRITNAIPGVVYQFELGADGRQRFLFLSDGIESFIGHSAAHVVSNFSLAWDAVVPEDRQALSDSIRAAARTLSPLELEVRVRVAGGVIKWIGGNGAPEPRRVDGSVVWTGILTDVTERKRHELETARLAAIVDNSRDAIVSRDLEYKILTWNDAAKRLFGYTAEEAIGQSIEILIPADRAAIVAQRRRLIQEGLSSPALDTVCLKRGGERIDVAVGLSPLKDASGKLIGMSILARDISARKQAEKILRLTQFSMDRAADAIYWLLPSAEIVYVNDAACQFLGYSRDELIGKSMLAIDPNFSREGWQRHWAELKERGTSTFETDHRDRQGRLVTVEGTVNHLEYEGQEYHCTVMRELSARRQAEARLLASEQSIRRLYEITNAAELSFNERVGQLLALGCERFGVPNGAVTHVYGSELEVQHLHSPGGQLKPGMKLPLRAAYCSNAMAAEEPLCYEHIGQTDWRDHPGYLALGMECYMGAKLLVDGRVYGTLCFLGTQPRDSEFTAADRDFLQLMAVWVGSELERGEARRQVQQSHDHMRQIIDLDPNFIFAKDREGRFTLVNKAVADVYGTTVENLVGKTDADFSVDAAELEHFRRADLAVMDSLQELFIAEERITDTAGNTRWLQTVKRPIVDESGHATQMLGAATDITARKHAEDALRASEERYRATVEQAAVGVSHVGLDGRWLWANRKLCEITGYSAEELLKLSAQQITHPDDLAANMALRGQLIAGEIESRSLEKRYFRKDGELVWVNVTASLLREGSGAPIHFVSIIEDISDRKRAETALHASQEHLIAAQSIAHLGSWEWNFHTGRSHWSEETYRLFGYEPGAVTPSYERWVERIHADDRLRVQEHLRAAFSGTASCDIEYRVVHPNGETRSIHWRGELFRDGAGNELRLAGTVHDITERKRAEDALREAHDQLERRVEERTEELARAVASLSKTEALLHHAVDVANLGIFERDHRSDALYYSPAMRKIFDLPSDQPNAPGDFIAHIHSDDRERVMIAREQASDPSGNGQMALEFRVVRRDGGIGWVLDRAQTFFEGTGDARRPVRTVGAVLDITESKQAEAALRDMNQDLDRRVAQRTRELGESRARLRALVGELTMTEERERRRLAVELHDTLAQSLAVVNMHLWRVRALLGSQANGAPLKEVLGNLDQTIEDSIKYTRSLISELSPPVLYDIGLPAAFRWLGEQMSRHGLRVDVDGPAEGVLLAQDDAVFLFQCGRELLWNVVKHGATDRATVSYGYDGERASLVVRDQGKGFDLQSARANGDGGSHFGLFSVRERVALRGGTIDIDSAPGKGTSISILTPVKRAEPALASPAEKLSLPAETAPASEHAIEIMIVDDHKMVRHGLRRSLEEQGGFIVVGEAGDGAQAVAMARALAPEVVIMDVNMPNMNGIVATKLITEELPSTIVIGVSFGTEESLIRAMLAAGAAACLAKERAVDEVRDAIMAAVAARQSAATEAGIGPSP